jgi:hypothetical protein
MKKFLALLLIGIGMAACNNDKTANTNDSIESNPGTPGMDNVHGNVADTTGAIKLNQPLPQDSSAFDSANKKDSIRR